MPDRAVRYHGMIDDQYGYRQRRSQPTKNYVVDAVDALLGGSSGERCRDTFARMPHWPRDEGRRDGPDELLSRRASRLAEPLPAVPPQRRDRTVRTEGLCGSPRLGADDSRGGGRTADAPLAGRSAFRQVLQRYQSEPRRRSTRLRKWVDEGCPEGNPAEKPPEKKFVDGWNIGKPDRVFTMERPFHVPATGVVDYQNIYASPVFTQDTWVQAVECRFGNRTGRASHAGAA